MILNLFLTIFGTDQTQMHTEAVASTQQYDAPRFVSQLLREAFNGISTQVEVKEVPHPSESKLPHVLEVEITFFRVLLEGHSQANYQAFCNRVRFAISDIMKCDFKPDTGPLVHAPFRLVNNVFHLLRLQAQRPSAPCNIFNVYPAEFSTAQPIVTSSGNTGGELTPTGDWYCTVLVDQNFFCSEEKRTSHNAQAATADAADEQD